MNEKVENNLAFIAEALILIILNQYGQIGMLPEALPVIRKLEERLIEVNKND